MNAATAAVDLANSVFKVAVADEHWLIIETEAGSIAGRQSAAD